MPKEREVNTWWKEKGCFMLNSIMIEIIGQKIGYVPLENLIDISEFSYEELIPILTKDGCTLKKVDYVDGTSDLLIYVK